MLGWQSTSERTSRSQLRTLGRRLWVGEAQLLSSPWVYLFFFFFFFSAVLGLRGYSGFFFRYGEWGATL